MTRSEAEAGRGIEYEAVGSDEVEYSSSSDRTRTRSSRVESRGVLEGEAQSHWVTRTWFWTRNKRLMWREKRRDCGGRSSSRSASLLGGRYSVVTLVVETRVGRGRVLVRRGTRYLARAFSFLPGVVVPPAGSQSSIKAARRRTKIEGGRRSGVRGIVAGHGM